MSDTDPEAESKSHDWLSWLIANNAAVRAEALRDAADVIDRGPTCPLPPTVISALLRERADSALTTTDVGDSDD